MVDFINLIIIVEALRDGCSRRRRGLGDGRPAAPIGMDEVRLRPRRRQLLVACGAKFRFFLNELLETLGDDLHDSS